MGQAAATLAHPEAADVVAGLLERFAQVQDAVKL